MISKITYCLSFTLCLLIHPSISISEPAKKKPNIVVIIADDLSFDEFGIYQDRKTSPSNTPNLDKLAHEGTAFSVAYAETNCTPSRMKFFTGKYASHSGLFHNNLYLPDELNKNSWSRPRPFIFTKPLSKLGYNVNYSGKYTIKNHKLNKLPSRTGISQYLILNNDPDELYNSHIPKQFWYHSDLNKNKYFKPRYWYPYLSLNGTTVKTTKHDYAPDLFAKHTEDFIEASVKDKKPFLAVHSMILAHGPRCATPLNIPRMHNAKSREDLCEPSKKKLYFHSQKKYLDILVQRIVNKVKLMRVYNDTVFIFTTDNGSPHFKDKATEKAVHVPFIVFGGGIMKRGLVNELTDFTDVFPTILDFAGANLKKHDFDGVSLKPYLTGKSNKTKDVIYAFPGVSRIVRTKNYMLEAVAPLYNKPHGRFYKTNGSFDGHGYLNITNNKKYKLEREKFDHYLKRYPNSLPLSFSDPIWKKEELISAHDYFNNPQTKKEHLYLPKEHKIYNDSF